MENKDIQMQEQLEKKWSDEQNGSELADLENEVDEITALKNELEKQQEENQKHYDLYLRSLAELDNFKKRAARDKEEYSKFALLPLIQKLLPVIDDLERALAQFGNSKDLEGLSKGVEMIAKSLLEIIKNEGVEPIEALGKAFDPQYHQPLIVEGSDEHSENTVIEEFQTGYILHGRVIRPSLVKVSK
ncbi:MAG: nucleotide exchange factor GrpE [Syntrophomonadaceae bacterium]|nr:nucleotide exchange factor GrpE [Syntrophomonadaceae bacterium]MDD3271569.1 nucleotide exchange factor GrpE [Syntrophomonadaceae bacterium]MDD3898421.1 nucleotide exchange factor GrpE [Syntrophomonadaceae bacterium]MDD4562553.1 nucleotide exchange factor GrpE [Syntrophomonadaceae bacterium]